jgi:hypothetical protein
MLKKVYNQAPWVLFSLALILVTGYIYLINDSVFNINERRAVVEEIGQVSSEIAVLEAEYMGIASGIDMKLAYEMGFQDASRKSLFAIRDSAPAALSLNSN